MDQTHPAAQVHIDAPLATALLREQCPDLMSHPPRLVDEGWDNVTFRIGPDHAIRLPRREVAVALLENEQRWLPLLGDWIQLEVPRPVFRGEPSPRFRWPWSVVEWVWGSPAGGPLDRESAHALASALRSLHRQAPREAPQNPFRGLPIGDRGDAVKPRLTHLAFPHLTELWMRAVEAPAASEKVWLHGDLHPRNVIVREGRLRGIIDWGDLCAGDPATDLACAWTLFEAPEREVFRATYAPTETELMRAAGWAVNFGAGLLLSGEPRHVPMGHDIVRRLKEA